MVSIPARSGAKANVGKYGKVEVILPVDRSRGKYKPRKTGEEAIKERIQALRQNDLENKNVFTRNRSSGTDLRHYDVSQPVGGFNGTQAKVLESLRKEINDLKASKLSSNKKTSESTASQTSALQVARASQTDELNSASKSSQTDVKRNDLKEVSRLATQMARARITRELEEKRLRDIQKYELALPSWVYLH